MLQNELVKPLQKQPSKKPTNYWFWFVLALMFVIWIISQYVLRENLQQVIQQRQEKFAQDSARLEDCVQYVLLADSAKYYPCIPCEDTDSIFLNEGEVWYYGETCYEKTRYNRKDLKK